jgi:hypothetical protein
VIVIPLPSERVMKLVLLSVLSSLHDIDADARLSGLPLASSCGPPSCQSVPHKKSMGSCSVILVFPIMRTMF